MAISDDLIFAAVIAMRFLVPLLILRYPLPGIVAAIAADAVDGAILHGFTSLALDNYQIFDKSLDIHYLAIAYVAMLRNWTDPTALTIGRVLGFYRLFGMALFALVGERQLLFLFPATFEFFFIFYETVRTRWNAERLAGSDLLAVAAVAWMIKLPQEYWLHVAERSTTDWAKQTIFGMDPATPRLEVLAANTWVIPVVLALSGLLLLAVRIALRRLPPPDHQRCFDANKHQPKAAQLMDRTRPVEPRLSPALVERVGLVTLVCMAFAEFLPGVHANVVQITIGLTFVVVANAALNVRFGFQGARWRSPGAAFALTCAINAPVMLALAVATRWTTASVGAASALIFVVLVSLLTALHDRYHDLPHQRGLLLDS